MRDEQARQVTILSLRRPSRVVPVGVAMQLWSPAVALAADPRRVLMLPPGLAAELRDVALRRASRESVRADGPRREPVKRDWLHRLLAVLS